MRALAILVLSAALCAQTPTVATFSIVARDPVTGALGVAVQSKVTAVGAVVPFAEAGTGALATQAFANVRYGPDGLKLLRAGKTAKETLEALRAGDERRERRQLGVVDAQGNAAAFTGSRCNEWAGHHEGDGYCCQGNILAGEKVVTGMAAAYEASAGLPFPERLLAALDAGQAAGGDRRGMQSAALLVVRKDAGYDGGSDRMIDLRVDDHEQPIAELRRVYEVHARTMLRSGLQRLLVAQREAKDRACARADMHHFLRGTGALWREATDADKRELVEHLQQLKGKAQGAVRTELAKDLEKLGVKEQ
jgi:uncharacterized Ntn-hydrolase superfamily protein